MEKDSAHRRYWSDVHQNTAGNCLRATAWSPTHYLVSSSLSLEHNVVAHTLGYYDQSAVCNSGGLKKDEVELCRVHAHLLRNTATVVAAALQKDKSSWVARRVRDTRAMAQLGAVVIDGSQHCRRYPDEVSSPQARVPPSIRQARATKSICLFQCSNTNLR